MTKHAASSAELTGVCQRLAAHYTALAEKESDRGAAGYVRLDKERVHYLRIIGSCLERELWIAVSYLVGAIHVYLDRQGYWVERQAAFSMNLTSARHERDRQNEGWCLNSLGYICLHRGEQVKALEYLEQSLSIMREIDNKQGEGWTLNNISMIYNARGDYEAALQHLDQSLSIMREIDDKEGEGLTLNNIGMIYKEQGDYETALKHLEESLHIRQEISDKAGEDATINNIAGIYRVHGDTVNALEYLKQSLAIQLEIGHKQGEAFTRWNIGVIYAEQSNLAQAEEYMSQTLQIMKAIGSPKLEECCEELARLRADVALRRRHHSVSPGDSVVSPRFTLWCDRSSDRSAARMSAKQRG
jgi:tetratricopeptide (TPR) repeat protein